MGADNGEKSVGVGDITRAMTRHSFSLHAVLAELIGMTLFVFTGCGTAVFFSAARLSSFVVGASDTTSNTTDLGVLSSRLLGALDTQTTLLTVNASWGINTAMAFGMSIMVLAYSIGHVSGCHLNAAVTTSLVLSGNCCLLQGIANILAQMVGSLLAAGLLYGVVPNPSDSSLGANAVSEGFTNGQALLGEIVMTCFLCYVVHMTAVDVRSVGNKGFAPLAIGFTVMMGHCVLLAVDGCSINPTRSFGPAAVSGNWNNFWVFVVGPIVGAIFSVPLWWLSTQPALKRFDYTRGVEGGAPPPEVNTGAGTGIGAPAPANGEDDKYAGGRV